MILASKKFVCAVPEAWFLSTVGNDHVKIIKMFMIFLLWPMVPYYGMVPYVQ